MANLFFEGDPATDSTRRHLQRVLNPPRPRTFGLALVIGGSAWGLWRLIRGNKKAIPVGRAPDQTSTGEPSR
jgi:hypothetical protein